MSEICLDIKRYTHRLLNRKIVVVNFKRGLTQYRVKTISN
jgi:hypothetical protein